MRHRRLSGSENKSQTHGIRAVKYLSHSRSTKPVVTHKFLNNRPCFQVENQMVSAERILGYCKVSQEANLESDPASKPKDNWPANGGIEVRKKACSKHPHLRSEVAADAVGALFSLAGAACLRRLHVSTRPVRLY